MPGTKAIRRSPATREDHCNSCGRDTPHVLVDSRDGGPSLACVHCRNRGPISPHHFIEEVVGPACVIVDAAGFGYDRKTHEFRPLKAGFDVMPRGEARKLAAVLRKEGYACAALLITSDDV